ncbi:MAG: aldehyde reductase [Hyphomicrobiaceae bacterium]
MGRDKVLVTGATGFIAKWCIVSLIEAGYEVRGTARSRARAGAVGAAIASQGVDPSRLELVEADLLSDAGWTEAAQGCRAVLHVASPFSLAPPRNRDDAIRPAREGTLRVLNAAAAAGVERVVLTSSVVAVIYPSGQPQSRTYDEADWTDPERADITPYIASKTLAERAAWEFAKTTGRPQWLSVVNPGLVLGPALDRDISASHEVLTRMASGQYPAVPAIGYPIVDARDVADAHLRAMTTEAAGGERIIAAEGYLTLMELGRLLSLTRPNLRWRLPWFAMHDATVRLGSRIDRRLRSALPDLGAVRSVRNDKARHLLGMRFHSAEDAAVRAIHSLNSLGLVR